MLPRWSWRPLYTELKAFFENADGSLWSERPAATISRLKSEIEQKQAQLDSLTVVIAERSANSVIEDGPTDKKLLSDVERRRMAKREFYKSYKV